MHTVGCLEVDAAGIEYGTQEFQVNLRPIISYTLEFYRLIVIRCWRKNTQRMEKKIFILVIYPLWEVNYCDSNNQLYCIDCIKFLKLWQL